MMSYNIKDYVRFCSDFLDHPTRNTLIEKLKEERWFEHEFYNPKTDSNISFDKELSVTWTDNLPEAKEVNDKLWFVIREYISDINLNWFNGWSGYSQVRFNRYDVGKRMELHCDHIHSIFDGSRKGIPVLSIIGSLNDDYEGGDLIFWESEKIKLKAGEVMVFPSNFMYPHRVDEVTKGTRYSFVSWVW